MKLNKCLAEEIQLCDAPDLVRILMQAQGHFVLASPATVRQSA